MFSRRVVAVLSFSLVMLAANAVAHADTVTLFTDRNAFIAAANNLQNITFEGIAPPGSVSPGVASLTILGVTFSDSPNNIFVVDSGFFPPTFNFGSGASLVGGAGGILAVLPPGTTAVGSDIMTALGTGPFQLVLSTGQTFTVTPGVNGVRNFAGVISDVAISSLRFNRTVGTPLFDNFLFGQGPGAPVPEPATIILLSSGLSMIGIGRRRSLRASKKYR